MPFLMKLLLEKGKTVVYLSRTRQKESCYYQFTPQADAQVQVKLHPEKLTPAQIPSLLDPDTYYLVDPGKTKDSCDPSELVKAHVIINTSPDERHWGESEFWKSRLVVGGVFLFYPLWKCSELLAAAPFIAPPGQSTAVTLERYRVFGGVPRHVFAENTETAQMEQQQGINSLTLDQLHRIAQGQAPTQHQSQPRSSVMGYESDAPFLTPLPVLISAAVEELAATKYMGMLWTAVVRAEGTSTMGCLFEAYVRHLMLSEQPQRFQSRAAKSEEFVQHLQLPLCSAIRLVSDPAVEVRTAPSGIMFHSASPQNELADFIFKSGSVYSAVQVTVDSQTRGALGVAKANKLAASLDLQQRGESLQFIYAVPLDHLLACHFVTDPVHPGVELEESVAVYVIGIPNPSLGTASTGGWWGGVKRAKVE